MRSSAQGKTWYAPPPEREGHELVSVPVPHQGAAVSAGEKIADTAPTAPVEATWLQTRAILRVIFMVLAVAATLWLLHALIGVLLLVVLAIFFAYLVAPLVEFACRPFNVRGHGHALPRALAIGVVYLLIFGSLGTRGLTYCFRSSALKLAPVRATGSNVPRVGARLGNGLDQLL